jgi:hypothetical protein
MRAVRAGALLASAAGAGLGLVLGTETRLRRAQRPETDLWRDIPVENRGPTRLGISFRPRQAEAFHLQPRPSLAQLLEYPFDLVRLAAYWDRIEARPGGFDPSELDWQIEAAEKAGKSVIICTGAVKAFGYPEYFVPAHRARPPIPEGSLVTPATHPELVAGAVDFTTRVVQRYRDHAAVVAWQVEHEAFDPLGLEHSWRLSAQFVDAELGAVRAADPTRPVIMNGFLPTSLPVRISQRWRTRGEGDSLAGALPRADIAGVDFYPRHGLVSAGGWTLYMDGSAMPWHQGWRRRLGDWASSGPTRRQVMIAEGQAEPWETVTTPPSPPGRAMSSCLPEHVITNYNHCMRWQRDPRRPLRLWSYLFWGAEYWLARRQQGDGRYLEAFSRILRSA